MFNVRRLAAASVILGLGVLVTFSHVWGDPARTKDPFRFGGSNPPDKGGRLLDDLAANKFANQPVVTYQTKEGETLFALQASIKADPAAPRARDYMIVIDTSASQAQGPLKAAQTIAEALVGAAGPDDRFSIWTVNAEARDLTRGFKAARDTQDALKVLKNEFPAGATNLKKGLTSALAAFDRKLDRQRVVLFLGDGMSILDPLRAEDRTQLATKMAEMEVAFFPMPLGSRLDPHVLHGLASGTGGTAIRLMPVDTPADTVRRVHETLATPILYPSKFQLSKDVTEFFPEKLPPMRADAPTLVVGKIKPGAKLTYTIEGYVGGKLVKVEKTEALGEPDLDNFFLVGMVNQWRNAKDQPALIRADRALAFAHEQNQLARTDLLTQAGWALAQEKLDAAWQLFNQARQLDPNDVEAAAGLNIVQKVRDGKMSREQLRKEFGPRADDKLQRIGDQRIPRDRLLALAEQDDKSAPKPPDGKPPIAPPGADDDLLKEAKQKQAVEDQRNAQLVDDAIRQANRILQTDPAGAHEFLKRTLDGVRNNPALSDASRRTLTNRLERALQNNDILGARIQRDLDLQLARLTASRERRMMEDLRVAAEDRIRERMRVFDRLMAQAREEEAARQAQDIRQDLINQGQAVPVAVTGGYQTALNGHHLREMQELVRIRRERFLLTLMQVERSAVPFPDEPPVEYPPAAVWKAITDLRKEKYETSGFTGDVTGGIAKRMRELREKLGSAINFGGFERDERMTLRDALDQLAELYDLTFDVNETAFKSEVPPVPEVMNTPVVDKQPLPKMFGVTPGTLLRKLLARIPTTSGATFIIRRDVIEITTGQAAAAEKSVRVYPVADLVIPIPNAFNTQSILNTATLFGAAGAAGFGGGVVGFPGGFGGFAGFNVGGGFAGFGVPGFGGFGGFNIGGGFGGFGVPGFGGFQIGGIAGALGVAGGGLNGFGAGFGGQQLGFAGAGGVNLGVGGGFVGFGGGALGQFGNLGGQFGLQGGDQSTILISLIQQVVGTPRDWAPLGAFQQAQLPGLPGGVAPVDPNANPEGNSIGFYPPAMALVVKGTSRIHTRVNSPLHAPGAVPPPPLLPNLGRNRDGELARNDPLRDLNNRVLGQGGNRGDNDPRAKLDPKDPKKDAPLVLLAPDLDPKDPRTVWQNALARAAYEPAMIIACADFLMQCGHYEHTAEFLKANLRQGIVVKPWVYEALALAMKESKASSEDIERAEMSIADLEPQDPQGLLKSAQAMAEHRKYDRAVAFCKQAAALQPNSPQAYAEALLYADLGKDAPAMEWAAGNLARQDWPMNNADLQTRAREKQASLVKKLTEDGRKAEAERMRTAIDKQRVRDLVIRMRWSGEADYDLRVAEPTGSVCSCLNRQTVGGGTLMGDTLADNNVETYVAAEAFSGEYKITVDRVWSRSLNDKVQLEIIQHQGTPHERSRLVSLELKSGNSYTWNLQDGRRKSAANVPPPTMQRPEAPEVQLATSDTVMRQLRDLANPIEFGQDPGVRGGVGGLGLTTSRDPARSTDRPTVEQTVYQTKVAPFVPNSADLTAQAAISADRRYVRLSVNALFNTVTGVRNQPVVNTSIIPGVFKP